MNAIKSFFPEPGMTLAFRNDQFGPRFCLVEGGEVRVDTAVWLRLNQIVYYEGEAYRNLGHALQKVFGKKDEGPIPYTKLKGCSYIWIPDEVLEFRERQDVVYSASG